MILVFARALIGVALFGAVGMAGIALARRACARVVAFEDGPLTGEPPTTWLVASSAFLGSLVIVRGAGIDTIVLAAVVWLSLVASWYCDVARGIVPDFFTLFPLAAIVLSYGIVGHRYGVIAAVAVPVIPFAVAAYRSKGLGMGWGDVKLVALGGAVLGMQNAVLAFGIACVAAFVTALVRRPLAGRPIAFVPYLAASIGVGIAFEALPPLWSHGS